MKDERKKKDQLIKELKELRQRVIELEASDADRNLSVQQKRGELFEEIVENILDAIIVTDTKGYIVETNKAFEQLLGYKKKEAIGKHMSEYALPSEGTYESTEGTQVRIDRGYLDKITTAVSEFAKNEKMYNWEVYFLRKDKKLVPVEQSAIFLYGKRGEKIAAVSIARDITQRNKAEKTIRELKDHLENIIESSLDSIVVSDGRGYISRVNKAFLELVGYREKEVIGRHIVDFTPTEKGTYQSATGEMVEIDQEFFDCARKTIERLLNKGEVTSWESYFLHKDGRVIPVERSMVFLDAEEGQEGGAVGIGRDITERKIKEKEIEEAKEFLENIFKTSADGILVLDPKGYITVVNEAMEKMCGYSRDELTGRYIAGFFSEGMRYEKKGKRLQKILLEEDSLKGIEYSWLKKDGSSFNVEINESLLKDDKGKVKGVVASVRDITDRKKAEETLRKSEVKYHSLIEHASDAIISADRAGQITEFNKKAEEMFGYSFEEVVGKSVACLTPSNSKEKERDVLERIKKNLSVDVTGKIVEGKGLKKDGQEFTLEASFYYLNLQGEDIYTSVMRDITERKRVEEDLRQTKDHLENIIENSIDCIVISDSKGYVLRANKSYLKLIGYTQEELKGRHLAEFVPVKEGSYQTTTGELVQIDQKYYNNVKEAGFKLTKEKNVFKWDLYLIRKDGKLVLVEMNISFIHNVGGDRTEAVGIIRDVTERRQKEGALRESIEKYHTLLATANDAIFIADAETGIITDANKKAEELSGIPVEDIIGMHQTQFHPKEDVDYYRAIFADHVQKGEGIIKGDIFIYHKNGYKIPVELSASVAKVSGKNIIQGIFRDMRDYKRAEEELMQTKDYLENIIEGSSDCIVVVDSNACIVKVNKSFLGLLGYKEEEVIGKNMVAFPPKTEGTYESTVGELIEINERFINNFKETNKKLLKEGKVNNWDTYFVRNDKKIVPVELNIDVLFNRAKEPIGAVGIVRDITERRSAERRIKELMERYRNLVEHANDAIISANKDGKIIIFNKKAEEIFGYTRKEILNKSVALLSIPSERENVIQEIEEYKGRNQVSMVAKIIEGKGLKKNGQQFSVETSFVALEIGGEYIYTGIMRDISERKKVEKKLVDYQRRLKSLTSQMTLTEEKERRRFAEYLHDQIGQKLFSLNLKLEEIRNSSSNNNCAGVLDNSFKIIKQLIKDTRSLTFELSPPILYQLGLGPALEWLTEQTREEYGIKVSFEDDEQEKELSDDIKVLLFQAVRELLINVAKHAKAQNAKVSIEKDNNRLRVSVEDDGVGLTPSYGAGFRPADGGFGLFSIRERLDFLGGQFNIESESGRGTRVMMVAPLKDEK